jgi:hypothetical protein
MAVMIKPKQDQVDIVPDGEYRARLINIREFQNGYGDRLGFDFKVDGTITNDVLLTYSTAPNLSRSGKLAGLLESLLGRPLDDYELENGFDIEDMVGINCNIVVSEARNKSGKVYSSITYVSR